MVNAEWSMLHGMLHASINAAYPECNLVVQVLLPIPWMSTGGDARFPRIVFVPAHTFEKVDQGLRIEERSHWVYQLCCQILP